ncbi:11641_t:CDS:2, partial [Ambispora gerdemannii]
INMGNSKSISRKQNINLEDERQRQQSNDSSGFKEEYYLPKTEPQIDRLQRQHFIVQHIFGSNFYCPMEETLNMGARVLDGGCGPGAWLLDMATNYPNSQFFGVDIEPVYPSQIKPENTNFHQCDLTKLEQLGFEENSFDMVRTGHLFLSLSKEDYTKIIEKMLKFPGGYFEISESESILSNGGPKMTRMANTIVEGLKKSTELTLNYEKMFLATEQLLNIQQETRVVKIGPPGGIAGELHLS